MSAALRVARGSAADLLRSRSIVVYALFFLAVAWGLFYFGQEPAQAIVSLLGLLLIVVPLVSTVVGMTQFYSSREFAELLLAQPIDRRSVFWGHYLGLSLCLGLAYVVGLGGPFLWYGLQNAGDAGALLVLLVAGVFLTLVFVGLAFLVSIRTENRLKAVGGVLFLWLYFAVLYDGLLLIAIMLLQAYPLENLLVGLVLLNPLDLARILILLRLDTSALMGYTGAVFERFFGTAGGTALSFAALVGWAVLPALAALRCYQRKDF